MSIKSSVTLEEINSVDDLVNKLDILEPPNRLVSALKDPLLQKYMGLVTSEEMQQRLTLWLVRYFDEELENLREEFRASENLSEVLSGLLSYTRYSGVGRLPLLLRKID